jgi:hypothetical protein
MASFIFANSLDKDLVGYGKQSMMEKDDLRRVRLLFYFSLRLGGLFCVRTSKLALLTNKNPSVGDLVQSRAKGYTKYNLFSLTLFYLD